MKFTGFNTKSNIRFTAMLCLAFVTLPLIFSSCNSANTSTDSGKLSSKLEIIGSTSTQKLFETLADEFVIKNPKVKINYQGVGSSKGIKAVKDGTGDIGTSSRELKEEEKSWGLKEYVLAKDGIAIAINPGNQKNELTVDQITKIFKGEITNWKDIGGKDRKIIVLSREAGSGTRGAFEELLKIEDQVVKEALVYDGNGPMKAAIASTEDAIGYISFGYMDDSVKTLRIDGVEPTIENVLSGSYPLSRPFIIMTKGEAEGLAKSFIDFALDKEGQSIVKDEGYIPIK
ncbi:MAG TPA: phosphate ABC transporter substrate-binding protein [Clostridiales bacterium]|nr:phosphate ABC transporter substrate-binding protein [Clostridiales bacterium]